LQSLLDLIEKKVEAEDVSPFPANQIRCVITAVASALQYLHEEKRWLHGDIKAANLLIKGDFEQIKLCDFGVALKLDKTLSVSVL